jgi:hypothetical protein
MDKTITIGGREITFRATARTPRLYRTLIGRDMIQDMNKLIKAFENKQKDEDEFDVINLQIFEDVAYTMARHANPDIEEKTADDWLDTFDMFSILEVLPHILELWAVNTKQTAKSKKK